MDRLFGWLSKNIDKVAHFSVSIVLTIIFGGVLFHSICGINLILSALYGVMLSFGVGIVKEVIDSTRGEKFDKKDLTADLIGDTIGMVILFML